MKRIAVFIGVGCAAAATHFAVVAVLVHFIGIAPLIANLPAFATAFAVSFVGHWRLSFREQRARWQSALPRFLAVALLGFAINEAVYALLLAALGGARYLLALGATLVAVAVLTYVLSRRWAFAAKGFAS